MGILDSVLKYKEQKDAQANADLQAIPQAMMLFQQAKQQNFENQIKSLTAQASIAKAGYKVGTNGQLVKDPSFAQSNPVFTIDDQGNLVQAGSVPKGGVVKQLPQSVSTVGEKAKARTEATNQANFGSTGSALDRASSLRKELLSNPLVKDYQEISSKVSALDSLMSKAESGDNASLGTIDQGLVTLFNKITDPQSVVRESEYARTPEGGSLLARFEGNMQKLQKGGAGLTPELRKQLVSDAHTIVDGLGQNYNNVLSGYEDMASKYQADPSLVFGSLKKHGESKGNSKSVGKFKIVAVQ